MTASPLPERLDAVRRRIEAAVAAARRPAGCVRLLAVSKGFGAEVLADAVAAGQRDFGENYVQEALPKIDALAALPRSEICWHFQGPLQSNKTADVARAFDWVHSVDREKVARRLSDQRPATLPPLNVCVQVNISGEATKSGVAPAEALALCRAIAALPGLKLRGLMAIPAPSAQRGQSPLGVGAQKGSDPSSPYRALRELFESINRAGFALDTLSAGMSDDFEAAIAEGSTIVRIGTAIFGSRRE